MKNTIKFKADNGYKQAPEVVLQRMPVTINAVETAVGFPVKLRGVPDTTAVKITGGGSTHEEQLRVENGNETEFEFDAPGIYKIELQHPDYQPRFFSITVRG